MVIQFVDDKDELHRCDLGSGSCLLFDAEGRALTVRASGPSGFLVSSTRVLSIEPRATGLFKVDCK